VNNNIRHKKAPNSFCALAVAKNTKFIRLMLKLFRQEAIAFVNYHDAHPSLRTQTKLFARTVA